jgi:hypothetical protein
MYKSIITEKRLPLLPFHLLCNEKVEKIKARFSFRLRVFLNEIVSCRKIGSCNMASIYLSVRSMTKNKS